MDLYHFIIRLNVNDPSLPSTIQITRHDTQFRLRLSTTRSEPIHLVTYVGPRRIDTDGLFRYRTTGNTHLQYQGIEPAGPRQFLVRLTLYPFYPPKGQVQRRADGQGAEKLWYGEKELRIYAWCGAYGEIGSLPYRVVDEPVQIVPLRAYPHPAPGNGNGNGNNNGGNRNGELRGGDGRGGRASAAGPAPVELPAQAPQPHLDNHIVSQLITHLCQEQTQARNDRREERRRQAERYDNLVFQMQVDEIGRLYPPQRWPW